MVASERTQQGVGHLDSWLELTIGSRSGRSGTSAAKRPRSDAMVIFTNLNAAQRFVSCLDATSRRQRNTPQIIEMYWVGRLEYGL